jgi:hypothetical protein
MLYWGSRHFPYGFQVPPNTAAIREVADQFYFDPGLSVDYINRLSYDVEAL